MTKEDLRPQISGRPCEELVTKHFSAFPGKMPSGTFPADWLTAAASRRA